MRVRSNFFQTFFFLSTGLNNSGSLPSSKLSLVRGMGGGGYVKGGVGGAGVSVCEAGGVWLSG